MSNDLSSKSKARIPTRPLSYASKNKAEPKEIIADYKNHLLYMSDENGEIYQASPEISEVANKVIEDLKAYPEKTGSIKVGLDSGGDITLEEAINKSLKSVDRTFDSDGNVILKLPAPNVETTDSLQFATKAQKTSWSRIGLVLDDNNNVILKVPAANIETTDTLQFVSKTEKESWSKINSLINTNNKVPAANVEVSNDLQFVTKTEKDKWNTFSATDSGGISNVKVHAYNIHTTDALQFVSKTEKESLSKINSILDANSKVPAASVATTDSMQFVSSTEKDSWSKINSILDSSGKVPASNVATTNYLQFVTKTEKDKWNSLASADSSGVTDIKVKATNVSTTDTLQFVSKTEKESWSKINSLLDANSKVPAANVATTDSMQFVSSTEKNTWNTKVSLENYTVKISSEQDAWTLVGESAYNQKINISDMKETDYPIADIVLSDDYNTASAQLEEYGKIYKIMTFDGYMLVFATEPTNVDLDIIYKIDR